MVHLKKRISVRPSHQWCWASTVAEMEASSPRRPQGSNWRHQDKLQIFLPMATLAMILATLWLTCLNATIQYKSTKAKTTWLTHCPIFADSQMASFTFSKLTFPTIQSVRMIGMSKREWQLLTLVRRGDRGRWGLLDFPLIWLRSHLKHNSLAATLVEWEEWLLRIVIL